MIIALVAGILSFLSPCVLPIVPPYLAYMGGISVSEMTQSRRKPALLAACFFVLGLSTVFLFLGFTASAFGQIFLQNQVLFGQIAGVMIMIFGLHFLHIIHIPIFAMEARLDAGDRGGSAFGAYVLGLAFAFGWTPCIGPILGAILSLAAQEGSATRGTILMAFYALGLGIPFILTALFINKAMGFMGWMKRNMTRIEAISGLLLWTVGLMMLTGAFSDMAFWLLETFPSLAAVG